MFPKSPKYQEEEYLNILNPPKTLPQYVHFQVSKISEVTDACTVLSFILYIQAREKAARKERTGNRKQLFLKY